MDHRTAPAAGLHGGEDFGACAQHDRFVGSANRFSPTPPLRSSTAVPGAAYSRCGTNPARRQLRNTASLTAESRLSYATNGSLRRSAIDTTGSTDRR